jgi:peptide/nickel transport system permease protein
MWTYVIRRILATIPVMAVVALFVFSLLYIAPGNPAAVIAGDQATPADVARISASLGLDRPFLVRFGEWSWQILHGDLGTSIFTNLPVAAMIGQRIEPTLSLMAVTLLFAVLVAVPAGVVAAWQAASTTVDRSVRAVALLAFSVAMFMLAIGHPFMASTVAVVAVLVFGMGIDRTIMAFAVMGFSVPVFVIGYVLAYVFALQLDWLPVQGYAPLADGFEAWIAHLILPALALGCVYIALIARTTRAAMLEVLQQDYIRTARAKGVGQRGLLFVHALKNAAVPIVTVIGIGIALLIGGAVVTETVFAIPGIGRLTVDAILRRDYPVIQGVVLLFSFVYVIVNLLVDLTYTLLDPRIRY